MSATIQSNLFSRYFMIPERTADTLIPAPVITLKSHAYVVTEMYIDNITSLNCSVSSRPHAGGIVIVLLHKT